MEWLKKRQSANSVVRLSGHYTLTLHLHILGFSESAKCRNVDGNGDTSCYKLCQCPALAGRTLEISDSAWLKAEVLGQRQLNSY
jgi:hypothetical protein